MNQSKPNRRSIRLPDRDYRSVGFYFVTFCTHNRICLFDDPRLHEIAINTWAYIPQQPHAQHVRLDESVIMPNHGHGLIEIVVGRDQDPATRTLQPGSVGAIMGNYKMLVTKRIKAVRKISGSNMKVWQRGYWERIIRSEWELNAVRQYIRNNPARWNEDRDNLDKLLSKLKYIDTP